MLRKGKEKKKEVSGFNFLLCLVLGNEQETKENRKKLKIEYVDPISCVAFAV